jgi:hypothetical protein
MQPTDLDPAAQKSLQKLQHLDETSGQLLNHPLYAFLGMQIMVRDFCDVVAEQVKVPDEVAKYWFNSKVKLVATGLGESKLYVGAYHDNADPNGIILSRDCGVMQDNIAAKYIGTDVEKRLRTESLEHSLYWPVVVNNVQHAVGLYATPMNRPAGQPPYRLMQPWVAYTSGWAMFPEFWVWRHTLDENGNLIPVGPWIPTGRYVQQAIRGVANWHLLIAQDMNSGEALAEAQRLAAYWKVECEWDYDGTHRVYYKVPPKPTVPPADGVGPRPKPNDGW